MRGRREPDLPVWDGEDDLFDVLSFDDLDLLPNLKKIWAVDGGVIAVPNKFEILAARGIAAA